MKRITKLFLFIVFLFVLYINNVSAIAPAAGVGGYYRKGTNQTGECDSYPNIRININNPSSESNLQSAFCVELHADYLGPWRTGAGADFYACSNYDNVYSCAEIAAAYIGTVEKGTNFWAAQTILNGRYFYTSSSCSGSRISTTELLARGAEYCTTPSLSSVTLTEGEQTTLTLSAIEDYTDVSFSGNLSVQKSGSTITILPLSEGTGTIYFSKGMDNPIRAFCDSDWQDLAVIIGYPKVQTTMTVNVEAGVQSGHLTVTKVDSSDSTIKLYGAEFKVCTNSSMTTGCNTYTTNSSGTFTTGDYELPQTLYFQELSAPTKYNIDSTGVTAVILGKGNNNLTVTDTKKRGYLSITKVDENHQTTRLAGAKIKICTNVGMTSDCETITTGSDGVARTTSDYPLDTVLYYEEITAPSGYRKLSGTVNKTITQEGINSVTVENTKVQMAKIKKYDSEMPSILLSGAKFKVCTNEAMTQGCLANLLVTGSNGETEEIGPYDEGTVLWVQEVVEPEYYYIDQPAAQRIVIGTEDVIKSFTDTIKKATFKLTKKDSVNSEILLEGAKYKVCTNESMTTDCVNYTTNHNGVFTTSEYRINTNIYYQEIEAPTNYQIDNNVYRYKLSLEGVNSITVTDVLKRGYLKMLKTTTDNIPISGTKFQIGTNLDGEQGVEWKYYTTNENGEITLPDVPVGTSYTYKEIDTPRGFINDNTTGSIMITNSLESNEIDENKITVTNEYVRGIIKIYKVDKNYRPLKGVQFKIGTNLDGEQGVDFDYYYTNESGEAIAENLLLNIEGDTIYKVQEIETLLGYSLDTEIHELPLNVEYTTNSNFKSIQIVNNTVVPLKEVKIIKLAKGTNEPISGVKINVYKKDGTLYREVTTDLKGEAQIEVEDGEYYFEEVDTPIGYETIKGKIKFTDKKTNLQFNKLVLDSGSDEFTEIIIYNDLINVKTGRFSIIIPLLIVLFSIPLVFIYLKKHQKLV